jgi:tRNA-2-methylthio-N6-dimethylallyladenosine synthase
LDRLAAPGAAGESESERRKSPGESSVARKYLIETFGCQMNVHDSERMAGLLEQAGFEATDTAADADLMVINTCSVRERAEDKLYTRLGELRVMAAEQGRDPIVAVAGCVAQQEGDTIFRRSPGVADIVVGTQGIRRLPMLVERASASGAGGILDLDPHG